MPIRRSPARMAGLAAAVVVTAATGLGVLAHLGIVITHGTSMWPGIRTGDVAVVRPEPGYRVGDVVAYRSRTLGITVLHRVVAVEPGRYVTRGDHNGWTDPDQPSTSDIRGRLVLHIPKLGALIQALRRPVAALLCALLLLALPARRSLRRRRGSRGTMASHRYTGAGETPPAVLGGGPASPRPTGSGGTRAAPASAGTAPANPHPAGTTAAPRPAGRRALPANPLPTAAGRPGRRGVARLLAALAVAALGSAAALALWVAPAPATATAGAVATPERLAVSYRGDAPPGAAYPGGVVSTGDPVFIRLVHTLVVTATYTGPAAQPVTLTAALTHPSGWRRSLPLLATTTTATSTGGTVRGVLDVREVSGVLTGLAAETGLPSTGTTLLIVPTVGNWSPQVTFSFDGIELQPDSATLQSTRAATGPGPVPGTRPASGRLRALLARLARLLPAELERRSAGLVILAAAAALAVAVARRPATNPDGVRSRRLLPVEGHVPGAGRTVVDLPDPAALVRLAEAEDLPVIQAASERGSVYFVDDGTMLYRYRGQAAPTPLDLAALAERVAAEAIARIAFDFRAPLATIRGYAELLTDESAAVLSTGQQDMLAAIDRGANRLHNMIDKVTVLAELGETGADRSPAERVDVGALIDDVCTPLADSLAAREIQVSSELDPALPAVRGDAERLNWALTELLHTTAEASSPGGRISIGAHRDEADLVLTISGGSPGVAESAWAGGAARPAQPGARAAWPGADLGLTVVRAIIDQHRGNLDLADATATIRLPAQV